MKAIIEGIGEVILKPYQTIEIPLKPANPNCPDCKGKGYTGERLKLHCICVADFDNKVVINH